MRKGHWRLFMHYSHRLPLTRRVSLLFIVLDSCNIDDLDFFKGYRSGPSQEYVGLGNEFEKVGPGK